MKLEDYTTYDLVSELEKREGVEKIMVEPYDEEEFSIEGPAIILIVEE